MAIPWKEEYDLGIKIIDEQHKGFVDILNSLYDLTEENKKEGVNVSDIFKNIYKYTNEHFGTEEAFFDEFDYEETVKHKLAHSDFIDKIKELEKKLIKNHNTEIFFEIMDFLENWLIEHLNDFDKKYVKCFKEHGLK